MERISQRVWIMGGTFLVAGLLLNFAPRAQTVVRTEPEVEKMLPMKVGTFNAQIPTGETVTYRMEQSTYDILKPWGIVARVFNSGNESYDVVAIASNNKESFHDPQVCFSAQGWALTNERPSTIPTKSHGEVPVTLVDMEKDGEKTQALYFFRINEGYVGDIKKVKMKMMVSKMMSFVGKDDEGAFIRVIPRVGKDETKMKKFVGEWIDEANKVSNGYY